MATTLSTNLYAPDVWADLTAEEFQDKAIIATSSAVLTRDDLVGNPGEVIQFPKWNLLTDLDDLTEGVAMTTEELTQSSSMATIKEAGKAVEFSEKAQLVGIGNVQDEAIRQFGILSARKVDKDLITAATATITDGIVNKKTGTKKNSDPLKHTITGAALTWDEIVNGLEKFGDDFEPSEFSGLYIRAEQRSQIMKDAQFIKASEVSAGGEGSIVRRGFIGLIAGMPVYVTNRLEPKHAVILKNASLGLFYKKRPEVKRDEDILKRTIVTTTNMHYAVKRLNDKGVLDLTIGG